MTSGEEIVPRFITTGNQCFRPEESKPAIPALTWFSRKVRTTLSQPAVGPLLIACVCLATVAYKKRTCPETNKGRAEAVQKAPKKKPAVLHRSMSIAALHGGKATLERILDAQEARIDKAGLDGAIDEMKKIIAKPQDLKPGQSAWIHFKDLHRAATKLEMSGKEDEAIKVLMEELVKALQNEQSLEAYEFEMILVEMLIYKGEFLKAKECKCLTTETTETGISDARVPLYKAIIYTMLNDRTNAEKSYEEFQEIRKRFHWPDGIEEGSPLYGIVLHFDEFEDVVQKLKKEIEHAHNLRAKGKL